MRKSLPIKKGFELKGDRQRWSLLVTLIVVAVCFAWATGRLSPHHVADTPSYLQYPLDSLSDAMASIRTPGYPIFVGLIQQCLGLDAVPAVQWLIACVAAWWFGTEMGRWSASPIAVWGSAFSILFGCTFLDHQSTLATDAVAASIGVCVVASLLRWIRRGRSFWDGAAIVALCCTAIMIRPAYLAIIVWVGLMGTLLTWQRNPPDAPEQRGAIGLRRRLMSSTWVAGACVGMVLVWMTLRWVVVDDFGMLPFGHQNLAGLTLQLVSDDELLELAGNPSVGDDDELTKTLVGEILNQRSQAIASGFDLRPGPGLPTLVMENQWNDLIYQAVVPASLALWPDDPIERHRVVGRLNRSIIQQYPLRYARWLLLAIRRSVWGIAADILMNPVFLCVGGLLSAGWFYQSIRDQNGGPRGHRLRAGIAISERKSSSHSPSLGANPRSDVAVDDAWNAGNRPNGQECSFTNQQGEPVAPSCISIVTMSALVAFSYASVMVGFVILSSPPLGRFADAGAILIPSWLMIWVCEAASGRSNSAEKQS